MKYGIAMFPTDYAIQADALARELEARGFESLWLPEHTHIPASRKSPWPGGGDLPREYWHTLDPFVALGAAAAVTKTLMLGTGICLVIERDPILLAKEVASLDHISGGRVLFGIGGGWNAEEMEHHGTPFGERWKILRERISAMKAIWTQEEAEYHSKYVNFDKLWSYPKPVQKPYPPILMGGAGPHARQRAADFDGHWMPIGGRAYSEPIAESMADFRARAEKAGRDPAAVTVSIFGVAPDEA
jgi:probable F420-dependent oxidoreductase